MQIARILSFCFYFIIAFYSNSISQEAEIWKKFIGLSENENTPLLPDYSYAGYKLGSLGIPSTHQLDTFLITDYGAIPDDEISDQAAIQSAINAAESNNGGIVFFPPGEFWVITDPENTSSIIVDKSNIILIGSGSTAGGTIINMKNHMLLPSGASPWNTPPLIQFKGSSNTSKSTTITQTSNRGSKTLHVSDASVFSGKKYIEMRSDQNIAATSEFLENRDTRSLWDKVNNQGIDLREFHEIESIDLINQTITLVDPLVDTAKLAYNWSLSAPNMLENCGFQNIHVKANFQDEFVHHKNYIHDYAWHGVTMSRVAHSWVKNCRFSNVTLAAKLGASYASSILMLLVDGNDGHALTTLDGGSTRTLQGLIWDNTTDGQWHGADLSGRACGSVSWRIEAPQSRGMDLHASFPRTNLIDNYESLGLSGQGGHNSNEPHHLRGLTLWNNKKLGSSSENINLWPLCESSYCGLTIVNPIIVGYHGSETTFDPSSIGYEESNGSAATPNSLYEAQLENRSSSMPDWITEAKNEWTNLKEAWYSAPSNLVTTGVSDTEISIAWQDNATSENNYQVIYSSTDSSPIVIDQINPDATSYTIEGLTKNTNFSIKVIAVSNNWKLPSNSITVKTESSLPNGPSLLSASADDNETLTIQWVDNSDDEEGFSLERSVGTIEHFTEVFKSAKNVTSFSEKKLFEGAYHYRVRSYNASGFSAYSEIASIDENNVLEVSDMKNANTIYPIPSSDSITISFNDKNSLKRQVYLFDHTGKQLKSYLATPGSASMKLDLNEFEEGQYFIKIETDAYTEVKKIAIKK